MNHGIMTLEFVQILLDRSCCPMFFFGGVVMMELAGGGSLSDSLYKGVSAEGALGGRRTALGDVPR